MKRRTPDSKNLLNSVAQNNNGQSIISTVLTNDLFWLLIVCGTIRLILYSFMQNTDNLPDSGSYLDYDINIFLGQVDCFRTPVYPYFIKLIRLFGVSNLTQQVELVQSVISFLIIIIFYRTVSIVFKNRIVIFMTALVFGIMPSFINYDKCILTESLSISAIVLFIYFVVSYLKKPTLIKSVLYSLYVFFLIMLRPSFLVLLPIMMIFWVGRMMFIKSELKKCIAGLITSFVCVLLIVGYSHLNYVNNGCNNISVVSSVNQLDIIIDYNIYEDNKDQEISNLIKDHMGIYALPVNRITNIDSFNDKMWETDEIISNEYPQERIDKFVKSCITQHSGIYIKNTLLKAVNLSKLTTTSYTAEMNPGLLYILKSPFVEFFSVTFAFIYLLLIFDFFYIILQWMKSKKVPWFKFILWTVITGQLATAIIGAENEHQRLLLLTLPFVIILFFSYIDLIFLSVEKKISK